MCNTVEEPKAKAPEILALAKKGMDLPEHNARTKAGPFMTDPGKRFLEDHLPIHCKPGRHTEQHRR